MKRTVTIFLIALLFSVSQASFGRAEDNPALDMPLDTVAGEVLHLSDLKGKVLVVNFWATWCPPCLVEIPELARFQEEFGPQGVQVIGIDFMERPDQERLTKFIKERGINYPIVFGKSTELQKFARALGGVFGLPVTKFLDREGKVVKSHVGGINFRQLKRYILPLLENN